MPFISQESRQKVRDSGTWEQVGDLCYLKYKPIIERWRATRRWTTAHEITKDLFSLDDEEAAKLLAFLVFFVKEVWEYEHEKIQENGDV